MYNISMPIIIIKRKKKKKKSEENIQFTTFCNTCNIFTPFAGVSVKFLMVGETNSMTGYNLMAEGHLTQPGVWRVP